MPVWLGGWRYEHGHPMAALDISNEAVKRLYGIGDHQPLAMAERLQAVKLRGHKGRVEGWRPCSCPAARPGGRDQTAAGTAALTAAKWRTADALVKWRSRDKEHRRDDYPAIALEAYKAAQSPRQVIKAMELIRQAHDRTSTPAKFTALVSAELSVLPADSSSELLGYLRYHEDASLLHKAARRRPWAPSPSVAEMRSRNEVLPSKVYNFAFALKAAGRFSEAADELDEIIETLKFLREKDRLPEPDIDYNASCWSPNVGRSRANTISHCVNTTAWPRMPLRTAVTCAPRTLCGRRRSCSRSWAEARKRRNVSRSRTTLPQPEPPRSGAFSVAVKKPEPRGWPVCLA